jgi:hypothetical protein
MAGPLNPTVEDCSSDDDSQSFIDDHPDPVLESFRRSSPGGQANVAAKRSPSSDLGHEKAPPTGMVVNTDSRSDSGYSSTYAFSAAPSADSALSAISSQSSPPNNVPPTAPSLPPASPAPIKRRPTISERRPTITDDRNHSPRKPLQRAGSVSRKPRERRPTLQSQPDDCTNPNCTTCGPNATPSSRGRPSPLDSAVDVSYQQNFDIRSQRPDLPSYISSPRSPTYARPAPYQQGPALIQTASTRRRSSSTNRPPRPMSFHGGDPGAAYWAAGPQGPVYHQEQRGPPPSASALFSTMHPPHMAPYMAPPPQPNYYPQPLVTPMQTSPPYDGQAQRPPMHSRTSSNYNPRGRPLSYGPPLVTQEPSPESMPSARYAAPQVTRQALIAQDEFESDSCESESSDDEPEIRSSRMSHQDRAIMPPPPPPPAPTRTPVQRRPSLRHAATTQSYNSDRRMSQSQTIIERPREPREREPREPRSNRVSTAAPVRGPSKARPALIQQPKAQSALESAQNARVYVENPESRRRQSYNGFEKPYQAEEKAQRRANRNSKIYADEGNRNSNVYAEDGLRTSKIYSNTSNRNSKMYADEPSRNSRMYTEDAIVQPTIRRRQTDTDARHREEQLAVAKAEAYQRTMRGSNEPVVDKVHKAAKRVSRVITGPSEAETSRSKGSDKASRMSMANRTNVTNSANGEIRLRVDASAPLSLQFNGDMDGRTLQIQPLEDGMADIVIGNPGSEYRNERQNLIGGHRAPKAIMASSARRDEESAERSDRSGHSRRDSERRVLQRPRQRKIEYNEYSD